MAPSPAAGKATGGTPRTPTKLGRKPQSSQTPKLGQASSNTPAEGAKKAPPKLSEVQKPETPEVPEKPEAGDAAKQASDTAKGAQDKAGEAAEDVKGKAEDVPEEASKVEMKDTTEAPSTAAGDEDEEDDDDEGPLSKVSQAGDQAKGQLEEQDPQPIDDSNDDTVSGAQEATEGAADDDDDEDDDIEDDNATEKAGDTADDTADDATDDAQETAGKVAGDTQDTAEQSGGNLLKGAKGLAGKASGLAGKAAKDPKEAAQDAPNDVKETTEDTADDAKDTAEDAASGAKDTAEDAGEKVQDTAEDATGEAEDVAEEATDKAEDAAGDAQDTAEDVTDGAEDTAEGAVDQAKDTTEDVKDTAEDATGDVKDTAEDVTDGAEDTAEGAVDQAQDTTEDAKDTAEGATEDAKDTAEDAAGDATDKAGEETEGATGEAPELSELPLDLSILKGLEINEDGVAYDSEGNAVGKLAEGDAEDLVGYPIGDDGEILDDDGDLVGRVELMPDEVRKQLSDLKEKGELPEGAEQYLPEADDIPDDVESIDPGLNILNGLTCDSTGLIYNDDGDTVGQVVDGDPQELQHATLNERGEFVDEDGNVVGHAKLHEDAADLADQAREQAQEAKDEAQDAAGDAKDGAEDATGAADEAAEAAEEAKDTAEGIEDELPGIEALEGKELNEAGQILDDQGDVLGEIEDQDLKDKIESGDLKAEDLKINESGEVVDEEGNVLGKVGLAEGAAEKLSGALNVDLRILTDRKVNKKGKVLDDEGEEIGELAEGDIKECAGKTVNDKGQVLDKDGNVIGKVSIVPGEAAEEATRALQEELGEVAEEEPEADAEEVEEGEEAEEDSGPQFKIPDLDVLEGLKVNKKGKILNEDGEEIGELTSGELSECTGKKVNEKGEVLDSDGNVIGRVKALPQEVPSEEVEQAQDAQDAAEDAQDAAEDAQEGAEGAEEGAEDAAADAEDAGPELPPLSILDGLAVNKAGKLVDSNGTIVGELTEGDAKKLSKSGITSDAEGQFWDNKGNVIGRAKTVAVNEPDEESPFAGLDGLIVVKDGFVDDENGNRVGQVVEGDAKKLIGRAVDEDGDILDKKGSVVGHAERWEEPEEGEPEEEEDAGPELPPLSVLEGLKVNKAGKLVDSNGTIVGQLVEGDAKKLSKSGTTSDAEGQFWDNKGNVIGRAETVPIDEPDEEAPFAGLEGLIVVKDGFVEDENENRVGQVVEGDAKKLIGRAVDEDGDIIDKKGSVVGHAERWEEAEEEAEPEAEPEDLSSLNGRVLNKAGMVIGDEGVPIARLVEGNAKELVGKKIDGEGQIWNDSGKVIGRVEMIPENEREAKPEGPFAGLEGLRVIADGYVADEDDNVVGQITEGNPKRLVGLRVDEDGDIIDKYGNVKGHADVLPDEEEEAPIDNSLLDGKKLNKQGFVVNEEGIPVGKLVDGNVKELAGRICDENGDIHSDTGKIVGHCEVLPESERVAKPEGPFAGLEGLRVIADGKVADEDDNVVGEITEGNPKRLIGLAVDEDGDIIDKYGNVKGHADVLPEEEEAAPADNSILENKKLNKQGFVVNEDGIPIGKLVEGNVKELAGRRCDENGNIHGDTGKIVGRCEVLPENERVAKPEGPFAGLEGLHVNKEGMVEDAEGNVVGIITEGDAKRLTGLAVDEDGDISDKFGNTKGHAEPWSEEEQTPEDLSALAGCTVNKAGNVVDSAGAVLGRVSEGDPKTMIGKKVDGQGQIWDNAGNVIGKAELSKGQDTSVEGPFAGFENITVDKDGMVVTPDGSIVGRVVDGDVKKLIAHKVDEEGEIQDKNGNTIGKAERWEPEEKERKINPMSGRRVNKEGEVRDENGDVMGRLTEGDLGHCVGLEVDDNGYVVDNDGNKVGEVTLLENIAEEEEIPEEELTDEQKEELRKREEERQIAEKMGNICTQTLERIQPVCKQITDYIEKADRTPREELDEEELVNNVKPLIEEGGRILQECNGSLRGLDPDGHIAAQAKGRAGTKEATPEEYRLADTLKELTTTVVTTIDNAKKRISDMPHAKKKLNPLWGLMTQPLFQILAAVGLLLTGVLGLVGQLLNGLGLGGLVNGLLGGLGINKLLNGLGLGSVASSMGLGKKDDKKKKGGVSSIPIIGGLMGGGK